MVNSKEVAMTWATAWAAPPLALLAVRFIEAGLDRTIIFSLQFLALCILAFRKRLDTLFWRHFIGEDSEMLWEYRRQRQEGRHAAAQTIIFPVLVCGCLFHLSRGDLEGAAAPTVIGTLLWLLKPEQGRYLAYFINGFAFCMFCFKRGGTPGETMLWSPILMLPLWNLMVVSSVSTHAAMELWRLAAVLHFCAITELRLVVACLCFLMSACRVLEGNNDLALVAGCRTERRVLECVNADRRQLIGVLSHEVRNRLDIVTNMIASAHVGASAPTTPTGSAPASFQAAAGEKEKPNLGSESLVHQSVLMQNSVSVVLDLLEIELPRTYDAAELEATKAPALRLPPMVRTHLGLLVHSAKQLQLSALNSDAVNTAATFRLDLDERLSKDVLASKSRLHWILRHLLANAYAGCGRGADASVTVSMRLSAGGDRIEVEVRNAGLVHSQAALDAALKTNQQGAHTLARRWGGCGLGLRHVDAMLRLLECPPLELTAEGNTVAARFVMPYHPCEGPKLEDVVGVPAGAPAAAGEGGAKKPRNMSALRNILVVDDEEFIRMLTVMMLEDASEGGCEVVTAENGEQGIAVYLERRNEEPPEFDLILMDIQMPVLTGDLAVKQMRTLERQHGWPHTCIIARSANTADSDQEHYKQCGMDGCIPKAGNVAKQVLSALMRKRQAPDAFVAVDVIPGVEG